MTRREYCDNLEALIVDLTKDVPVESGTNDRSATRFGLPSGSSVQLDMSVTLSAIHGTYCGDTNDPEFLAGLKLMTDMKRDPDHQKLCEMMPTHVFCRMTDVLTEIESDVRCEHESKNRT